MAMYRSMLLKKCDDRFAIIDGYPESVEHMTGRCIFPVNWK
jgi:hypothetical protein